MVRPRLVEEGAPIYGPGSGQPSSRVQGPSADHEMHDHSAKGPAHPPSKLSSLQRLAQSTGASLPTSPRRSSLQSSHYEIQGQQSPSQPKRASAPGNSHTHSWNFEIQSHPSASTFHDHHRHHNHEIGGHQSSSSNMDFDMQTEHAPSHPNTHSSHVNTHQGMQQYQYSVPAAFQSTPPAHDGVRPSTVVPTSYTIGGGNMEIHGHPHKMEGVEDHGEKTPMVILDGANVAHAYATAAEGWHSKSGKEPDAVGIQVAVDYYQAVGIRVLVVLPQYWFRSKPRPGVAVEWRKTMDPAQQEILGALQNKGFIVASPPTDDDDAYALTIARREESRSMRRNGEGPGFILSNDMFRDAQDRDTTGALKHWLIKGRNESIGPGRISYSFADMGTMNDHGERILDFVPNPRHPLIIWIEGMQLQGTSAP